MTQKLIETIAYLKNTFRRLLLHNESSGLFHEQLPVGLGDLLIGRERIASHVGSLEHEQSTSQIARRLLSDARGQLVGQTGALGLARLLQYGGDLLVRRRGHPQRQTSRSHRGYDTTRRVAAEYQTTRGHVLFHGATERVLCVLGESIDLGEEHHLEALLRVHVQLIRLRNILDQLLYDNAIVDARIARVDLDVIVARQRGHLDRFLRRRLELLPLDAQLFHARTVEFA